jgi:hypothetical protein
MAWYFALFIDGHPSSKVEGAKEFLHLCRKYPALAERCGLTKTSVFK